MRRAIAIDARLLGGQSTGDSTYWNGLIRALAELEWDGQFLRFTDKASLAAAPRDSLFAWIHVPAGSARWWSFVRFTLAARRAGAGAIHVQYSLSPLCGRTRITTIHDVSFLIGPQWFMP